MFELLQEEYQFGCYDANGIQEYVTLGVITQEQANQITGANAQQSQTPQAAQSATPQPTQSNTTN